EYPSFYAEGDAAGISVGARARDAKCFAEVIPMKIDRADREIAVENHFNLDRIEFLHEIFRTPRRLEKWIGGVLPFDGQADFLEKAFYCRPAAGEKRLDLIRRAETDDLAH